MKNQIQNQREIKEKPCFNWNDGCRKSTVGKSLADKLSFKFKILIKLLK